MSIVRKTRLPNGFKYVDIEPCNYEDVYKLIIEHYSINPNVQIQMLFNRDYIYWHLYQLEKNLSLGLTFNNKLVGFISAIDIGINKQKTARLCFLTVQSSIRCKLLLESLLDEIKARLLKAGYSRFVIDTIYDLGLTKLFTIQQFAIPINFYKLRKIGLVTSEKKIEQTINPLHLFKAKHSDHVSRLLNSSSKSDIITTEFTPDLVNKMFTSIKNVCYSFVMIDYDNVDEYVSDFVSVYEKQLYCIDKRVAINTAYVSALVCNKTSPTVMIEHLVNKLRQYSFDQLIIPFDQGKNVNIEKFTTNNDRAVYIGSVENESLSKYSNIQSDAIFSFYLD